eukprot:657202-Alexandrium_andersonii.AAC.1
MCIRDRPKTAVAPLFSPGDLGATKAALLQAAAIAEQMAVQDHAKYLGILLGPWAGDKGWGAPVVKYQARALRW